MPDECMLDDIPTGVLYIVLASCCLSSSSACQGPYPRQLALSKGVLAPRQLLPLRCIVALLSILGRDTVYRFATSYILP